MNLREAKFAVLDLETTGLNPRKDEILAIGIVPMDGLKILSSRSFYSLVRPEKPHSCSSARIHGISVRELKHAPSFEDIADDVEEVIGDRIIVGHCVEIDCEFLTRAFAATGRKKKFKCIDIVQIERALGKLLGESYLNSEPTLENLAKKYGLKASYRHNALADAFIAAQIFLMQLVRLLKYGVNTTEKLLSLVRQPGFEHTFGF